jgi:hypothetical protein
MAYSKTTWVKGGTPPINDVNLNKMEQGIADAHTHGARIDNPHAVTKTQVGLGSVIDKKQLPIDGSEPMTGNLTLSQDNASVEGMGNYFFVNGKNRLHLSSNAYYDGAWKRYDTLKPAVMLSPHETSKDLQFNIAEAGANPISWATHSVMHGGNTHLTTNGIYAKSVSGDWNNITETGFYMGNAMTNQSPGTSWRWCQVIQHNASWIQQTMWSFGEGDMYIRTKINGVWSAWKTIWHSGNSAQTRWLNGEFQSWNGTEWVGVGIMATKPRVAELYNSSAVAETWYTVIDITSSNGGKLSHAVCLTSNAAADASSFQLRITIDGVIQTLGAGVGQATSGIPRGPSGDVSYGQRVLEFFLDTDFKSTMKIEAKTASTSGGNLITKVEYSLV